MPPMVRLFIVPELAAGMRPGRAAASARKRVSTTRCEVSTFPPATAAGVTAQDKKVAGKIVEDRKACILVVNKWDLYADKVLEGRNDEVGEELGRRMDAAAERLDFEEAALARDEN